ncbi:MAG: caspase family protein [Bacteroidia bacterium]|nr:caspase family protein [Bacteroidia bacterium]
MQIEEKDTCTINFYIKNTGTLPLQKLDISIADLENAKGIYFDKTQAVRQINIGDSALISIPVKADGSIKNGNSRFSINVADIKNNISQKAEITLPTKETLYPPVFTWTSPVSNIEKFTFPIISLSGTVTSKSRVTSLTLFVNGRILNDNIKFSLLPGEKVSEYRISRALALNEGYNEVKIEMMSDQGTSFSETRLINYNIQNIDETYKEKRLALVIGNSEYVNSNPLPNPVNDAKAIAQALRDVDFTVLSFYNADQKTMKKAMDDFGEMLKDYNVGLFYYAGHGLQVKGNNYLIPVEAVLKVEQDVDYDCIDAGRLLGKMEAAGTSTNIIILDACRDNPFERSWGGRSTAEGNGLAFMNAPSGSIVAYATSPGKTASDGAGKNGLYTEAILEFIKMPGLSIEDFFKNVRATVEKKSNKTQVPWESTSLKGNFYFKIR